MKRVVQFPAAPSGRSGTAREAPGGHGATTLPSRPGALQRVLEAVTSPILSRVAFFPDRHDYADPAEAGLRASDLAVVKADGGVLRGWHVAPPGGPADSDAPIVVFLPGNSGNLSSHLLYIEMVQRSGCRVFAVDSSGFGRSDGHPDLRGLLDDALRVCDAARDWARAHGGPETLGLFGLSIGANLALAVAATRSDVSSIAVEGLSIHREIIRGITIDGRAGPCTVSELLVDGKALPPRDRFRFPGLRGPGPVAGALSWLATVTYPFCGRDPLPLVRRLDSKRLLVIHGTSDRLFPFEAALEVHREHGGESRLWLLPGIGHAQEPALVVDEEYAAQLADFFVTENEPVKEGSGGWRQGRSPAANGEGVDVEITAGEASGENAVPHLVTVAGEERVDFHRISLEPGRSVRIRHPDAAPSVHVLRMFRAACTNGTDRWAAIPSRRRALMDSGHGVVLRRISSSLHARRPEPAARGLRQLAQARPPYPVSLVARLHCVRLEEVSRRRHPELAVEARQLFELFRELPPREAGT